MYTTFSVVESIPPLTSRRRRPVSFSSSPVVAVSLSPPVVKISQALLTRSTLVHVHARSVYARPVQLTRSYLRSRSVHGSRRAPQFTTRTSTLRPYRSTDFVQFYLRRPLGYSHRPSHNTHLENLSIDSLTIRSFYSASSVIF